MTGRHADAGDPRAGDPYVCVRCALGEHSHCLGPGCECVESHEGWVTPSRRKALRAGAEPLTDREAELQDTYRAHQEDRRAADGRRS